MQLPRTKLRTLLSVIGLIGYSFGTLSALRHPSFTTLKIVESVLVLSLLFAVVGARFMPGNSGAFWFGYAAWGGTFYIYIHNTWQVAHVVYDVMSPLAMAMHFVPTNDPFAALNQAEQFEIIHAVYNDLFALWMGCLGGLAAILMASRYGTVTKQERQA
jgi:hypothetical protein